MTMQTIGLIDLSHPFNPVGEELPIMNSATGTLTFLDIFLGQCAQVEGIDLFHILVRESHLETFVPRIGASSLPAKVQIIKMPDSKTGYFYDEHPGFLKARKWCHQTIRGGVADMTVYDEIMPMLIFKQLAASADVRGVLHLHPSFPMFDPDYASQIIRVAKTTDRQDMPYMIFRQATLGLCPAYVTRQGLDAMAKGTNWAPAHVIRGDAIGDGLMNMNNIVQHDLEADLTRGNLTLNTHRDSVRLCKILHFLMAEDRDIRAKDISEVLFCHPIVLLESFPREVEIETCDDTGLSINPLLFGGIYGQCVREEDCRVSITPDGEYQDVYLETVKKGKPYGLNIVLPYGMVVSKPEICCAWIEAHPDMVTIKMHPLSNDISEFKSHLTQLVEYAKKNDVLAHVELVKDDRNWRAILTLHDWAQEIGFSYNWVQANPSAVPYVPMKRGDCEKIMYQMTIRADGTVTPCKRCTHKIGDVNRNSIQRIWESCSDLRQDRFSYLSKFPACKDCAEWLST